MENSREKRHLQRRHLFLYVKVYGLNPRRFIGYLADISLDGFLILSEAPLELGPLFSLEIDLEANLPAATANPVFTATAVWAEKDANPKYTITGFQFEKIDQTALDNLKLLMETYGFTA